MQSPSIMKVFESAGKKPGLQVWRVEKMELAEVPRELYGNFYTGDSYIVLATMSAPRPYNLHAWHGSEASQDEMGAAAILLTQLDQYLKDVPVQYIEFQEDESCKFMGYFPHGIKYKKGGVASGFTDVTTNEVDVQRLLHVKGRRCIRAIEVDLSWSSFNTGDCFIIDLGKNIYHWSGSESNRFERLKTTQVAKDIRDNERRGRAEVHMICEGQEDEEVLRVLGPKPELPSGSPDQKVSKKDKSQASLHMISDKSGSITITPVAEKNPFKQDDLCQKECYIVANKGDHTVFVWKGSKASEGERAKAFEAAQQFIRDNNFPKRTKIEIIPAFAEPTLFKEFFFNWLDKDETTGPSDPYTIGSIAKVEKIPFDASSLHDNKAMAAQHGMVDDGSGKVEVWRVENGELKELDKENYGQFYGGDCYLVRYTYEDNGRKKSIIYYWQGNKCSRDELAASAFQAVHLDDCMGGAATQVRVTQGQEPPHLVAMFEGLMIVYLGGTCRDRGQSAAASTRLFDIRISSTNATRAVEVEPTASALNTNDVFVLKTPQGLTLWRGSGAVEEEMEAARKLAEILGGPVKEVKEGEEPADFWAALGGKKEYHKSKIPINNMKPPRLFGCSNKSGNVTADEVPGDWQQTDLATDDIMILDSGNQIFVWIGKDANQEEKDGALAIAQDYLASDPSGRSGIPIYTVNQGEELPSFTGWFQAWDPKAWDELDNLDNLTQ